MTHSILEFVLRHSNDEWDRLARECAGVSFDEFTWQPGERTHSIGWHVRHAIEWRYALVHLFLCRAKKEEELVCLGWESNPLIQSVSDNVGWYEPHFTVQKNLEFMVRVRLKTTQDLVAMPISRYWEPIRLPWRENLLLDEIFQDVRHSALHRGHIRQIRKMYAGSERFVGKSSECYVRMESTLHEADLTS